MMMTVSMMMMMMIGGMMMMMTVSTTVSATVSSVMVVVTVVVVVMVTQSESEAMPRVDAIHTGKEFLRVHCSVERFARLQAVVATLTLLLLEFFAEVLEKRHAPAFARLSEMDHLSKLRSRDPRFGFGFLINEMQLLGDVAWAEKQHAFAG